MNCPRCGGWVGDTGDDLGPRCWNCGRSPLPLPTQEDLLKAGITQDTVGRHKEMEGRRGPKGAIEYNPSHLGLVRPFAPWRR